MSFGTRPAILISELLEADGPFLRAADDFLARTCTRCRAVIERDGTHLGDGYFCISCWAVVGAVTTA